MSESHWLLGECVRRHSASLFRLASPTSSQVLRTHKDRCSPEKKIPHVVRSFPQPTRTHPHTRTRTREQTQNFSLPHTRTHGMMIVSSSCGYNVCSCCEDGVQLVHHSTLPYSPPPPPSFPPSPFRVSVFSSSSSSRTRKGE